MTYLSTVSMPVSAQACINFWHLQYPAVFHLHYMDLSPTPLSASDENQMLLQEKCLMNLHNTQAAAVLWNCSYGSLLSLAIGLWVGFSVCFCNVSISIFIYKGVLINNVGLCKNTVTTHRRLIQYLSKYKLPCRLVQISLTLVSQLLSHSPSSSSKGQGWCEARQCWGI